MALDAPVLLSLQVCGGAIAGTWLLSVLTREYSWVDRIWSIIPAVYVAIFWADAGFSDPRLALMTALVTLWGARLTFNYWRKGGYAPGGEDYRWAILRERLGPVWFQVFNATFISPYQNALLWLIALPAWRAWAHAGTPLTAVDGALAALFLTLLAGEFIADQQQWDFHQEKQRRQAAGQTMDPPFLTTGLWRWSRHPNFFCEVGQWWVFFAIAAAASGSWLDLTLAGPVLLTLLFDGSTRFTESITRSRYPSYAAWQATTPRLVPLPWPRRAALPADGSSMG